MMARPASGRSAVDRIETVVVFPDPFGPSSPSTDPAGTRKLSPSRASTVPKAFRSPSTSTAGCSSRFPYRASHENQA